MSNLTLLWNKLTSFELGKDVILVPKYLGQILQTKDIKIVCDLEDNVENILKETVDDIKVVKKKMWGNKFITMLTHLSYLLFHARRIDVLMCFHLHLLTIFNVLLFRILNKNGRIYVKLDSNGGHDFSLTKFKGVNKIIRKWLYRKFANTVDVFSCETSLSYNELCNDCIFKSLLKEKTLLIPNGVDEYAIQKENIVNLEFEEKENLIITVGRLGSFQKNTELLIKALENIELHNWKVLFIGPIEDSFRETIANFFNDFPEKNKNVFFYGPIYNKKRLWEMYNKSKVFVLTSRWESYGLVLNEAKRFRNYIISTEVGAASDLIENRYGRIIKDDDYIQLRELLETIVNGKLNINCYKDFNPNKMGYDSYLTKLIPYLK